MNLQEGRFKKIEGVASGGEYSLQGTGLSSETDASQQGKKPEDAATVHAGGPFRTPAPSPGTASDKSPSPGKNVLPHPSRGDMGLFERMWYLSPHLFRKAKSATGKSETMKSDSKDHILPGQGSLPRSRSELKTPCTLGFCLLPHRHMRFKKPLKCIQVRLALPSGAEGTEGQCV